MGPTFNNLIQTPKRRKENIISADTITLKPQAPQTAGPTQHQSRWWHRRPRHKKQTSASNDSLQVAPRPQVEPDSATDSHLFGTIEVSFYIARALKQIGYEEPTPIQQRCISPLLARKDVVGQALTGTGKTAAFGIPLVEQADSAQAAVQGLVLVPTRELAMQVRDELIRLAQFRHLGVVACYGGQPISKQITALERQAHIVVGTPGRVLDHLSRGTLQMEGLRTIVLDEADQMLDIGFLPSIERILAYAPEDRQTALFSATMPSPIRRIVIRHMRSPMWVRIGGEIETAPNVCQLYYEVLEQDRVCALVELLKTRVKDDKVLLFRRTQAGVDQLVRALQRQDIAAAGVHGGMPQAKRNAVMRAFQAGHLKMLVATNLAARGLDIPQVSYVVNYDMPQNLEEYVHRIGRTARMGRDGTAITFVTEWDFLMLDDLLDSLAGELKQGNLSLYEVAR
jgi:ATP-dependent RNA helicase DeaD